MKKKLLSLLLSVLTVVLLPISALAVSAVEEITVTGVASPVLNGKMDFTFTIPQDAGYEMDVYYADYLSSSWTYTAEKPESYDDIFYGETYYYGGDAKFTKVGYYTFAVDVRSTDGYVIDSSTLATVNNVAADICLIYGSTWRVYYTFEYLADVDYEDVSLVEITDVFNPIVGARARFEYTIPENAGYEKYNPSHYTNFEYVNWIESKVIPESYDDIYSIGDIYWADSEDLIFKEGYYYTFIADIDCVLGYEFTSDTVYTVNGNEAGIRPYEKFGVSVWYTFTPEPIKDVTSISITEVIAPVVSCAPEFDYEIPEYAGYSKALDTTSESAWVITETAPQSKADLDNGKWIFSYMFDEDNQAFYKDDLYYTFVAFIEADGGIFSNNLTASINGNDALIDLSSADYGLICVYYTFKQDAPKKLTSIKINTLPIKTEYKYNENFDFNGIVVEGIYEDGSSAGIIDNALLTFTGFNSTERGINTVTVEYNGLATAFDVEIKFTFWNWLLYIVCFGWIWM